MTKNRNSISRKRKTAFHEAGHAVAAYLLRKKFRYVTIRPNEVFDGYVRHEKPRDPLEDGLGELRNKRSSRERDILTSLAGGVATFIVTGKHERTGSYGDLQHALDLAEDICGSREECDAYIHWLSIRCEGMLRSPANRFALEALAGELLRQEKVSYRRAREIIKAAKKEFRDKKPNHTGDD
jgi:ATP-dependent Zn protease